MGTRKQNNSLNEEARALQTGDSGVKPIVPNDIEKLCQSLISTFSTISAPKNMPIPSSFRFGESFELWRHRLTDYLSFFPEEQQPSITMSLLDESAYEKALTADITSRLPIRELLRKLGETFRPRQLPIEIRYNFKRRDQIQGEDCEAFLKELRRLEELAYPESVREDREQRLLEQFTEGVQDKEIRRSFFTETPASLSVAVERANRLELINRSLIQPIPSFNVCGLGAPTKSFRSVAVQTDVADPPVYPYRFQNASFNRQPKRGQWQRRLYGPHHISEANFNTEWDPLENDKTSEDVNR